MNPNVLITSSKGERYIVRAVKTVHSGENGVLVVVSTKHKSVDILLRDQDIELSWTDEEP